MVETASRLPRDATVVALLALAEHRDGRGPGRASPQRARRHGNREPVRRREFEQASAHLAAEGIEARHLKSVESAAGPVPAVRVAMVIE